MLDRRMKRQLIAGLIFAIVANVAVISLMVSRGAAFFAGNVVAILVCAGAIGLVAKKPVE